MFQAYTDTQLILGFGLWLGLTFIFTFMTYKTKESFMGYLLIFAGIVVYAGVMPEWVLSLVVIGVVVIIVINLRTNVRGRY